MAWVTGVHRSHISGKRWLKSKLIQHKIELRNKKIKLLNKRIKKARGGD
jgi:hypothetical protein